MSSNEKSTSSLPTRQQLLAWERECAKLEAEFEAMKIRHAAEEKALKEQLTKFGKFVELGKVLAEMDMLREEPETAAATVTDKPDVPAVERPAKKEIAKRRSGGKSWTATIRRIVNARGSYMSYAEVKDEVAKTHLGETLKRTEKAFYGGIKKLCDRGELVKHNGHLFAPKAYQEFMEDLRAGRVEDLQDTRGPDGGRSPNEIAIERFLVRHPNGATTGQIVYHLLNDPPADLEVTTNKKSIYNLLSRQKKNGALIKRGERYYLPKDEAPGPNGSSASSVTMNDGNGTPLFSSRQGSSPSSSASPSAISAHPAE